MNPRSLIATSLLCVGSLSGCSFDEGLMIENMTGKVVVPREAATQEVNGVELTDPRLIGPVYLGLFASVEDDLYEYPHPEVGPLNGDTLPYGGTTVGDVRFACAQELSCRVTSGRYTSFDDIVSWWRDTWGVEFADGLGEPITNGESLRQYCFDLLNYTDDSEVRITVTEDANGDGAITDADLQFVENANGDFEAEFTVWQQEYFASDDGTGFSLWGWVDTPSSGVGQFSSCVESDDFGGYTVQEYNLNYDGPVQYIDVLNFPDEYIRSGDYVASQPYVYTSATDADVEIRLDFLVE